MVNEIIKGNLMRLSNDQLDRGVNDG